jgi:polar amino acid transport system substrate-binding protein
MLRPSRQLSALAIALFTAIGSAQAGTAQVVRVCHGDVDLYPWILQGKSGLAVQLLEMVGQRIDVRFEVSAVPWKRCLSQVKAGQMDGAIMASYKPDRAEYGAFPSRPDGSPDPRRRLMLESYSLYRRSHQALGWDGSHIQGWKPGMKLAAPLGYSVVDDLKKLGIVADESLKASEDILRGVANGVFDAGMLLTNEGDAVLRHWGPRAKVERVDPPFALKPYYLMFSRQFTAQQAPLAERIWDEIAQVRASDDYQQQARHMGYSGDL